MRGRDHLSRPGGKVERFFSRQRSNNAPQKHSLLSSTTPGAHCQILKQSK
jgi:hypothetical protein